jgi:hypothetical protein
MRRDTGSQNSSDLCYGLGQSLLDLWREPNTDIYARRLKEVGNSLIEFGLIATWQAHRLQLIEMGEDAPEQQYSMARTLVSNAESLLSELSARADKLDVRDEVRLLSLITVGLSGGQELPSSITINLKPSREAVDIYSIASFIARNFDTTRIVCGALKKNNCQSRTMDSLLYYTSIKETALIQRGEIARNEEPMILTPWEDLNIVISHLRAAVHLVHCLEWDHANSKCDEVLNIFPQCCEAKWLRTSIALRNHDRNRCAYWTMIKDCELLGAHTIERTKALINGPKIECLCNVLDHNPGWGMDQAYERLAKSVEAQKFHLAGMYTRAKEIIESTADREIASSSYDPFELALLASQVEDIDPKEWEKRAVCKQNISDIGIVVVSGPAGPYMSNVEHSLTSSGFDGLVRLDECFKAMEMMIEERYKKKYPQDLARLGEQEIIELRQFLWQNIAFTHGGKTLDKLVWCSDAAYRYIGLAVILFAECTALLCLPPVEQLIIAQYAQMAGYSYKHATATLSELVAHLVDYTTISNAWNLLCRSKVIMIPMACHSGDEILRHCNEALGIEGCQQLANSEELLESLLPQQSQYEELFEMLEEFGDDLSSIEQAFSRGGEL